MDAHPVVDQSQISLAIWPLGLAFSFTTQLGGVAYVADDVGFGDGLDASQHTAYI